MQPDTGKMLSFKHPRVCWENKSSHALRICGDLLDLQPKLGLTSLFNKVLFGKELQDINRLTQTVKQLQLQPEIRYIWKQMNNFIEL